MTSTTVTRVLGLGWLVESERCDIRLAIWEGPRALAPFIRLLRRAGIAHTVTWEIEHRGDCGGKVMGLLRVRE